MSLQGDMTPPSAGSEVSPQRTRVELVPASHFSFEQLASIYNQGRVDYIVPMPMNAARIREYVHKYDVDLELSAVAVEKGQALGLAMLGVRPGRSRITRMGVSPPHRRRGTGCLLAESLITQSRCLQVPYVILEVIENNTPAQRLFVKLGFRETRELLIARRPPGPPAVDAEPYRSERLTFVQALELLEERGEAPAWLNETASLRNAGGLAAFRVRLDSDGEGWIVCQQTVFQLGHLVLQTLAGDPHRVSLALLHTLHTRCPAMDTKAENLPADAPYWPAMQEMGYIESFRRVEMRRDLSATL